MLFHIDITRQRLHQCSLKKIGQDVLNHGSHQNEANNEANIVYIYPLP